MCWRIMVIQALFWISFISLEALSISLTDPWLEARGPIGVFVRYRYLRALRALLTFACLWLAARHIDRRPFADFGFNWDNGRWRELAAGFSAGLFAVSIRHLIALVLGVERITEVAHVPTGLSFSADMGTALLAMFLLGFTEEGMLRAHPMKNLAEGFSFLAGTKSPSLLATAVILPPALGFAFVHVINGGDYWINAGFFLACFGVIFGCIFYVTGSLAFPIGLHAAWDYGNIFLFRVNAAKDCYLFRMEPNDNGWGRWIPNDNLFLILITLGVLIWFVARTARPGFRSPLFRSHPR